MTAKKHIWQSVNLIKYIVLSFPLEIYQPAVSAIEEEFPLSPEPGYQQEFSSLDREAQQAAPLLQVKEEEERETCRRGLLGRAWHA